MTLERNTELWKVLKVKENKTQKQDRPKYL